MTDETKSGWGVIRPGDRKAHYYRGAWSLCGGIGFYFGPIDEGEDKPSPDDCAQCRKTLDKLNAPPVVRVTEAQADLLGDFITQVRPDLMGRYLTLSNLSKKGLIAWVQNATNTGASWEITDAGKLAWANATDKTSSASRQHFIDTGRYLKRGETK